MPSEKSNDASSPDLARRAKIREAVWAASRVEHSLLSYGSGSCGFAPGRPEPASGQWVIVPAEPYRELTSMLRHLEGSTPWPGQLPEAPTSLQDGNISQFDEDGLGSLREVVGDHHRLGFGHGQAAPAQSQTELAIEHGRGTWVALDAQALPFEALRGHVSLYGGPLPPRTTQVDPEQLLARTADLLDHARSVLTSVVPRWRDFAEMEIASCSISSRGGRRHRLSLDIEPGYRAREFQGAIRWLDFVADDASALFATGTVEGLGQVLQDLDVEALFHLVSYVLERVEDRDD